jgi:hypothetical protein
MPGPRGIVGFRKRVVDLPPAITPTLATDGYVAQAPRCRMCRKAPAYDGCGGRCISCWAYAAATWLWNGLQVNALVHPRGKGRCRRRV